MLNVFFLASLMILVAFSVPLWIRFFANVSTDRSRAPDWLDRVIPRRRRIESPMGAVDVIILFVFWFLAQAISIAFLRPIEPVGGAPEGLDASTQMMWVMSIGQLLGTLGGLMFIGLRHGHAPRIFGWQPEHFLTDTLLGLAVFSMTLPPLLLLQWGLSALVDYHHQTLELLRDQATEETLIIAWLSAGLIAPITEEIFFRGVLQSWLQRMSRGMSQVAWLLAIGGGFAGKYLKPGNTDTPEPEAAASGTGVASDAPQRVLSDSDSIWMPILVSSAAFGLVHVGQGLAPVTLFFFGLVLGIVFRQTGSLWPCIVLHMLLNWFSLFWVTLEVWQGSPAAGTGPGWFFGHTIG